MVWVTKTADLTAALGSAQNRASAARNALGLAGVGMNVEYVRLDFPVHRATAAVIPTFVDGADNAAFCLWSSAQGSGFTWHLSHHNRGLPEAVLPPVELDSSVTVQYLGATTKRHPPLQFSSMLTIAR